MRNFFFIVFLVGLVFSAGVVGYLLPHGNGGFRTDTVTVLRYDTVTAVRPIPTERTVIRTDTLTLALTDTIIKNDSIIVTLPVERKVYEDSLYRAVISGIHPSLDTISVRSTYRTVTVTKDRMPRLTFGIQAGGGFDGKTIRPYIGVGVQYNLVKLR